MAEPRTFDDPESIDAPLVPEKNDFDSSFFKTKVSPEEFSSLMNTEEMTTVYGRFTYRDIAGNKYETGFCLYHLKTGSTAYCRDPAANYTK